MPKARSWQCPTGNEETGNDEQVVGTGHSVGTGHPAHRQLPALNFPTITREQQQQRGSRVETTRGGRSLQQYLMIPPMFGYRQAMLTPAPTMIRFRIITWKMLEVDEKVWRERKEKQANYNRSYENMIHRQHL